MKYPSRELTPAEHAYKSAFRLSKLAPIRYRVLVRQGHLPDVRSKPA